MSKAYAYIPIDQYVCTQLKTAVHATYKQYILYNVHCTRIRVISRLHLNTFSKEFKKNPNKGKKKISTSKIYRC